jgi:hypothetical protein
VRFAFTSTELHSVYFVAPPTVDVSEAADGCAEQYGSRQRAVVCYGYRHAQDLTNDEPNDDGTVAHGCFDAMVRVSRDGTRVAKGPDDISTDGSCARDHASSASGVTNDRLGEPVVSRLLPIVVPSGATLDSFALEDATTHMYTYWMPKSVPERDAVAWYDHYMPRGRSFHELAWLEASTLDGHEVLYWCHPGQWPVHIDFGTEDTGNDPQHAGLAFVQIGDDHSDTCS